MTCLRSRRFVRVHDEINMFFCVCVGKGWQIGMKNCNALHCTRRNFASLQKVSQKSPRMRTDGK